MMIDHLSKNQMKLVKSLQQKKYRDQEGLFLIEGIKPVGEALASKVKVKMLAYEGDANSFPYSLPDNSYTISAKELKSISSLKSPNRILAVCSQFDNRETVESDWILVLDQISDPGNLGTIIRICDWMDIRQIVCSSNTVDLYNPKVIQSSMGSVFRVNVTYRDLESFLADSTGLPVYGADMLGTAISDFRFPEKAILVMGSESHGLSPSVRDYCSETISIPRIGGGESLNVAVSSGIILSHLRSR